MKTLYIRLPARSAAEHPLPCGYALAAADGAIEREGTAALAELAGPIREAWRVVLLLAGSDVTLLRLKAPPLAAARLKMALPALVEDRLLSNPEDNVIAAAPAADGLLVAGAARRDWLEGLRQTLTALGARRIAALPSALCLPAASAAALETAGAVDVALRLTAEEGCGLSLAVESAKSAETAKSAAFAVMQTLAAIAPPGTLTLYAPAARLADYQKSLSPALAERIHLQQDNWPLWVKGANEVALNLMGGLEAASGAGFAWRRWRWPLSLGAALLAVNIAALNLDWLGAKREAAALNAGMVQTYKAAFPQETVILDPLAQMRQKIAAAQNASGQLAADDFLALAAAFSEAWAAAGQTAGAIAALEYRERVLTVKLKPASQFAAAPLKDALAARHLTLSQSSAEVWQIRRGQ
ncbi:MAG: hypothetical protein LBV49_03995 [Azonexus sp.]|nr:hypothetical protein [Azonexus sp.]